jgi:hypothetical protein
MLLSIPTSVELAGSRAGGPKVTSIQHPVEERDQLRWENFEDIRLSMEDITTDSFRSKLKCIFVGVLKTTEKRVERLVFAKFDDKTIGNPPIRAVKLFAGPHILNPNAIIVEVAHIANAEHLTDQYGLSGYHPTFLIHDWHLVQFDEHFHDRKMEHVWARVWVELNGLS